MSGNKMGEQTKEKIIQAALGEFLEKGYEKAKVDDIAKRAGLTKVMLYYHFNSKENILSEITLRVIRDINDTFQKNIKGLDTYNPQSVHMHLEAMLKFFMKKSDVIRLLTLEYLKAKDDSSSSFDIFEELLKMIVSSFKKDWQNITDRQQLLVRMFFFNTMPMIMYSGLSDKFNRDFGLDAELSRRIFIDTFISIFYQTLKETEK